MDMGCTFSFDARRLMVVVTYPVSEVSLAYVDGDPSAFVVLFREDVIAILVELEIGWKGPDVVGVLLATFACPNAFLMV